MPVFQLVPIEALTNSGAGPPQPQEVDSKGKALWRRGFKCQVKLSDQLADKGPTIREWASCAFATTPRVRSVARSMAGRTQAGDGSGVHLRSVRGRAGSIRLKLPPGVADRKMGQATRRGSDRASTGYPTGGFATTRCCYCLGRA